MAVTLAVMVIFSALAWMGTSYNPLRLTRLDWYLVCAPELLRYCFVPRGAPEASFRGMFGTPEVVIRTSDSTFRKHIEMRRRHRWTVPPRAFTDRALVYIDCVGIDQIEAYYFVNGRGRLAAAYISKGP